MVKRKMTRFISRAGEDNTQHFDIHRFKADPKEIAELLEQKALRNYGSKAIDVFFAAANQNRESKS